MFGLSNESPQNENSIFNPQNIYGISKLKAFDLVKNYRQNYKIFHVVEFYTTTSHLDETQSF